MTFPILVTRFDGRFRAAVLDSPAMCADGDTKTDALNALRAVLDKRVAAGELVLLDLPYRAVTDFAGLFREDPTLEEMVRDIYRERDAQKAEEHPE